MGQKVRESIGFDDAKAYIYRVDGNECYISFEPPYADPIIVAPKEMAPDDIVGFVRERLDTIRDLRTDMNRRFEKSQSPLCKYQTDDVAYLMGRPFIVKVHPLSSGTMRNEMRGSASVSAKLDDDVSVINLFVMQPDDYDQRRRAFMAWAEGIYRPNVLSMMKTCARKASVNSFPDVKLRVADSRGLDRRWARADWHRGTFTFISSIMAYPMKCSAYVFMVALASEVLGKEVPDDEWYVFIETGCPSWREAKELLEDPNNVYAHQ